MPINKDFPYATSLSGLKGILQGIPGWGTPKKVTGDWLAGVGFKGGAAARSLAALRAVGIVDSSGVPTDLWAAFRAKDRVKVAAGIRKHYSSLFETYSDAHRKDTEAILDFIRSKTDYGEDAQQKAAGTFKVLCEFGDFDAEAPDDENDEEIEIKAKAGKGSKAKVQSAAGGGVALTVNLQLQLPESADGDVYEKLFAAMAKHLKGLIGAE